MTTTIFVRDLIVVGVHGAHLPTAKPKEFSVAIDITVDSTTLALQTDDISHVYDYREAVRIARTVIEGPSVHLIETLAHRITEQIAMHAKVQKIKLTLSKREFGDTFDSGIIVEV